MPTAADIIARRLFDAGCRHAFGIPGGEVLTLMDALSGAGIKFILTKHENSAGFMAEGTFHSNGAPGVLVATLGPGVANAVTVIANAMQDRVPLIFLTGCVDPADALTYTHQVFDHRAMLAPITKASFTVVDDVVDVVIDKAVSCRSPSMTNLALCMSMCRLASQRVHNGNRPAFIVYVLRQRRQPQALSWKPPDVTCTRRRGRSCSLAWM